MSGNMVAGDPGRGQSRAEVSQELHGGDFSWALGIVAGAGVYWAPAGRRLRQEAARIPAA